MSLSTPKPSHLAPLLQPLLNASGCVALHRYPAESPLAQLMSIATRRPSPALVVSAPPDPRGTAECAALAQAALDTQQLDMVFPGEVEPNRAQATFQLKVKCLLDSGAPACFISRNLARKLRLPFQDSGVKAVNTAADAVVPVAGVVSFMLKLSGVVTPPTAHILPSFIAEAHLILGQDYHKSHSVVLD